MRLIGINSLKPGDVLSTPLRNQDGSLLLQANRAVTDAYISRLKGLNISALYVVDDLFDDVLAEPVLDDEHKTAVLRIVGDMFSQFQRRKQLNIDSLINASGLILDNLHIKQMPISLINLFAVNDKKCLHAFNVAMMVTAMSVEAGWNRNMATEYITAALLHDLLLESMTEKEPIQHTFEVYKQLKDAKGIPPRVYMACFMHHDAFDGSGGSAQQTVGKQINEGARMIAVADYYDNLTNGYCGQPVLKPHHALEMLNTKSGTLFDPDIVKIFNTTVSIYPTGSTVLLNNGYRAIVTQQNDKTPSRPIVRLLMKDRAECLEFNLLTSRTLFIDKIEL